MKKTILSISIITSVLLFSCNQENKKPVESNETKTTENTNNEEATKTYKLDTKNSMLEWSCGKMVGGAHNGTVLFSDGKFGANDKTIINGKVEIDLKSIENKDITDKGKNADLIGHLKSPDFFDTEKYPTAFIIIKKISPINTATNSANVNVTADLSIKSIAKEITFPALITINGEETKATASFKINRKDWGMNYGTEGSVANLAKDRIINNDIDFKVSIIANEIK